MVPLITYCPRSRVCFFSHQRSWRSFLPPHPLLPLLPQIKGWTLQTPEVMAVVPVPILPQIKGLPLEPPEVMAGGEHLPLAIFCERFVRSSLSQSGPVGSTTILIPNVGGMSTYV